MRRPDRSAILPRFSLARPITVLVMLFSILVIGAVATVAIPLELLPRGFTNPFLFVFTTWNDAPAEEVVDKLTEPLEEELSTVPGLARVNSFSSQGFVQAFVGFKSGVDMDVAYREVRDRVNRAKARMPEDVNRIQIRKNDTNAFPVYMFGIAIDDSVIDSYNLIQNEIITPIKRIDGVAGIQAQGLEEKEILIELDRSKATSLGLNIYQLGQQLAGDNFSLASGNVRTGDKKLLLRSVAKYDDLDALRNRPLTPSVRLGDVATVRYAVPELNYRARAMSKPAIAIFVLKESEANAIEVADQVNAVVEGFKDNPRLELIDPAVFLHQGQVIRESLATLLGSGRIGAGIAIIVLFYFLRRMRMTLIITLSIPLSMLIGLTAMYFFGETLNILSLLGLMISVGLLVDNSVVVAENIYRLHAAGASRREACIRGASEISLAIVMATLTTIIVFLPVSLVEGQGQFFLMRLSIPISVSLVASLFVALIFVPLSCYLTLPPNRTVELRRASVGAGSPVGWFQRLRRRSRIVMSAIYTRTMAPLNAGYTRMLGFFMRRRLDLILAVMAVFAITQGVAFDKVDVVGMQEEERGAIEIDVDLPQNTLLEEAEQYFQTIEKALERNSEAWDLDGYFIFHRATNGEVQAWLKNPRTNDLPVREITEKLLASLPEKAGAKAFTGDESLDEQERTNRQIFTLYGNEPQVLEDTASELGALFVQVPGVLGIKKASDQPANQLALVVDRDRAQNLGINPQVVAGTVAYALRGQALPKFYRDGKEIPVRVRFQEQNRESLDQLADFQIPTGTGDVVRLSSVTAAERLPGAKRIVRRDKQIARTITIELEPGTEKETRERLVAMAQKIDLPEGVRFGTETLQTGPDEDVKSMMFAMLLSTIFIYLLMGFLFESFVLPLSILMTIPLAGIGVGWVHYFAGHDIDFLGVVGIVLLVGVVVNNGIVLIDYVNRLRAEGMARREAVLLAADRRFRPIMMTALTTVAGMIPLTLGGTNSIGMSYTSFGLTLIGGMTTATLLTLLVVPVAYTLFDDVRLKTASVLRRAVKPRRGGGGVSAAAASTTGVAATGVAPSAAPGPLPPDHG
ncbi:MAG: efflux RND transporter permease subunit [Acidobacteriota bacterium]